MLERIYSTENYSYLLFDIGHITWKLNPHSHARIYILQLAPFHNLVLTHICLSWLEKKTRESRY